jgi:hypothetical protein
MKLNRFLVLGAGKLWLASLVLAHSSFVQGTTYTMSSSGNIPMVDGAYSFAGGDMLVVDVPTTNATPITMNGNLTITGSQQFRQTGVVSGTGDLNVNLSSRNLFYLDAPFTGSGNICIDIGTMIVTNSSALGSSVVYVNEETTNNMWKRLMIMNSGRSETVTITNAFVLGTEATANNNFRLSFEDGQYIACGPITVNNSRICCNNGSLTVRGAISGNKVVFWPTRNGTVSIEEPISLSGQLWIGNGGKVYLNVPGCTFASLYGYDSTTLVMGGKNYFPAAANFASQDKEGAHVMIDLNGYNQTLGSFSGEGAARRPFTILNSRAGTCPTVTIWQKADNLATNLHFSGRMDLVKEGPARLTLGNTINGTITVRNGTLYVGAPVITDIAKEIIVDGGVLDLGGQTVSCRRVSVHNGSVIQNGSLNTDRLVLNQNGTVRSLTVTGEIEKTGEGVVVLPKGTMSGNGSVFYALPSGTSVYYPFDGSLATALRDATTNGYDLVVKSGTPVYSNEGRSGGCLYFDGNTTLEVTPFPELVPTGNAPYTVSFWAKASEDSRERGGWIGYGKSNVDGGSNNFRLGNNGFSGIWNYWWARDLGATLPSGNFKDGWHHVVGTWDGATRRIYCDGVIGNSDMTYIPNFGNEQFLIGKTLNDNNFTGWIDDILIANRAFSDEEITTLYQNGGVSRTTANAEQRISIQNGTLSAPDPNLVVSFHFNSAASLFMDSTAACHDLKVGGGSADYSNDGPFASGGSLYLNGSSWLTFSDSFPETMPIGGQPRTIAAFIKRANSGCGDEGAIVSWGNEGWSDGRYVNFAIRGGGYFFGLFPWGYEDAKVATSEAELTSGWTSFVVTWNGSNWIFYKNGIRTAGPGTFGSVTLNTDAGNFKIGKAFYNGKSFYKGNIAELSIWSRALEAKEVATYHSLGTAAVNNQQGTGEPLLAETVSLAVSAGASYAASNSIQTVAVLEGAGDVGVRSLTVTKRITASVKLSGDLTLAEGVTVTAEESPMTVSGALSILGGGTVILPVTCNPPALYPLFTVGTLSGATNLAAWAFTNLPHGAKATMVVADGMVGVRVTNAGSTMILR